MAMNAHYPWNNPRIKKNAAPFGSIILANKVAVSRNLKQKPFVQNMKMEDLRAMKDRFLAGQFTGKKQSFELLEMEKISVLERRLLFERGLIPDLFLKTQDARYLALSPDHSFSIVLNGTEQIQWSKFHPGPALALESCWDELKTVLDQLAERELFACHSAHGFLCADPALTGTGLKAGVLLHLPCTALSRETQFLHNAAVAMDLSVTGLTGDRKLFPGNFYLLSNTSALGTSEEDLLKRVSSCAQKIAEREQALRAKMIAEENMLLRDFCSRSEAVLSSAYILSSVETMNAISGLMLARDLDLPLKKKRLPDLFDLLLAIQPAHIEQNSGADVGKRGIARAQFVRDLMNGGKSKS